jgi:23S rRNA pseudouridine1911/1915/1917 synthase
MGEKMKVLYEDNHIIVVVKKPDQPVMEDESKDPDLLNEVKEYIRVKYEKPGNVFVGLVHRLDRPVGGVMVFAKTSKAASRLSESMRNNDFDKKYYAIVDGIPQEKKGTIESFLYKDEERNTSYICDKSKPGSKYAKLHYKVIEKSNNMALLDIDLETGRHHQIRVQLASIGTPIYGDMRYGNAEKGHIALFAYSLCIIHPITKETMEFHEQPDYDISPWPLFK